MSTKRSGFRKSLPLISALTLILALLFALASPVSAATLCVKPSGAGACYASIQAAVNAAGPGDVIKVFPGTYNESVDLFKAGGGKITLRSVNNHGQYTPGRATVNGGGGRAFHTSSDRWGVVVIEGFTVNSTGGDGIHLHVKNGVVIRDVTANSTGGDGINVNVDIGNLTIENCTANDNLSDGIGTDNVGGNLTITGCTTNDNGDDGIELDQEVDGDVLISDCTSNNNANEGIEVEDGAGGNVAITDCTANGNDGDGIYVDDVDGDVTITGCITNGDTDEEGIDVEDTGGDVTIRDCTANDNSQGGFDVRRTGGNVTISNCTANGSNNDDGFYVDQVAWAATAAPDEDEERDVGEDGDEIEDDEADELEGVEKQGVRPSASGGNVTLTNCTANDNDDGFDVDDVQKALTITNCTANGNEDRGFEIEDVNGDVKITASVARDNDDYGVQLDELGGTTLLVNGSIICGNGDEGLDLSDSLTVDARGNWWGCTTGPGTGACDTIDEGSGTANYTPWIDTITPSQQPADVSFQFSNAAKTVFLGEGPGDLHGDPPFTVTTDNGQLIASGHKGASIGAFINRPQGVLNATLVPAFSGPANVTLDGPCDLDAVLALQQVGFVPEPGSVVLLASGLMGLAGYAGIRLRKK